MKIYDAITGISDEFVEEALNYKADYKNKTKKRKHCCAMAASLTLVVGIGAYLLQNIGLRGDSSSGDGASTWMGISEDVKEGNKLAFQISIPLAVLEQTISTELFKEFSIQTKVVIMEVSDFFMVDIILMTEQDKDYVNENLHIFREVVTDFVTDRAVVSEERTLQVTFADMEVISSSFVFYGFLDLDESNDYYLSANFEGYPKYDVSLLVHNENDLRQEENFSVSQEERNPYSRESDEFYQATYEVTEGTFVHNGRTFPYKVTSYGMFGDVSAAVTVYTIDKEISFHEIMVASVGRKSSNNIYDYAYFLNRAVLIDYWLLD